MAHKMRIDEIKAQADLAKAEPIFGKDVFIPMEWVIGGDKMIGHGWEPG